MIVLVALVISFVLGCWCGMMGVFAYDWWADRREKKQ